jgi:hypothetical protein
MLKSTEIERGAWKYKLTGGGRWRGAAVMDDGDGEERRWRCSVLFSEFSRARTNEKKTNK